MRTRAFVVCGIVGFTGPPEPSVLSAMTNALAHRGPDGMGMRSLSLGTGPVVHFGHRRLAVIDIAGGAQPMASCNGRWVLTYNGEIYNYRDLRTELEATGCTFTTQSDTEVLLQALAQWGEAALPRLDGMFAFAVADVARCRLVLGVDRFGQKPLVYTVLPDGGFLFSSEISALRKHPAFLPKIDSLGIARVLAVNRPPAPTTIYRDVFRLAPGHVLVVQLDLDGRVLSCAARRWWRPAFDRRSDTAVDTAAIIDALRVCTRKHLVADVPVGILLSGGIDSTAVAAVVADERPIITLSLAFDEPAYDESTAARQTATLLGAEHHEFRFSGVAARDTLGRVIAHLDEPLADAGCLPAWELYRQSKGLVTVALGGDGGDELLEGYPTFRALELSRRLGGTTRCWDRLLHLAECIPVSDSYYPLGYQVRRFLRGLCMPERFRLEAYIGGCAPDMVVRLLRPEIREAAGLGTSLDEATRALYESAPAEGAADDPTLEPEDADVLLHLRRYLAGEVLRKVDRMSMAHGFEVRAPMLGSDFSDLCLRATPALRRHGGVGKLPLRRFLANRGLAHVVRGRKRGFAIPVARWLRREWRSWCDEIFLSGGSPLQNWCEPNAVAELWEAHRTRRTDARKELWALLTLGLWWEHHSD